MDTVKIERGTVLRHRQAPVMALVMSVDWRGAFGLLTLHDERIGKLPSLGDAGWALPDLLVWWEPVDRDPRPAPAVGQVWVRRIGDSGVPWMIAKVDAVNGDRVDMTTLYSVPPISWPDTNYYERRVLETTEAILRDPLWDWTMVWEG